MAKEGHRGWGKLRRLPSGRWQASYIGPDLVRHNGPTTYEDRDAAVVWLRNERTLIETDEWSPPTVRAQRRRVDTLTSYADAWLAHRPLKARTVAHYRGLLDRVILPEFGSTPVRHITPETVRGWYARLDPATPTQRAHSYALLKAILATAVDDDLLPANPCRIRGAGQAKRASRTTIATPDQLAALIAAMPDRYRAMTALAGWCGLRFGETIELRRRDVDLKRAVVHVRRAASLVNGEYVIGTPKSDAGVRNVAIPPHVAPLIREHLAAMPMTGRDALLFPAAGDPTKHLRSATLAKVFDRARIKIERPDLRWHDLRHTAASLTAGTGATAAELRERFGWSTPGIADRYVHAARGRDAEIAAALSKLAGTD